MLDDGYRNVAYLGIRSECTIEYGYLGLGERVEGVSS